MPDHSNTHNDKDKKLSDLFKMLSMRLDNDKLNKQIANLNVKKLKKRIGQTKGLVNVNKRLRKPKKQVKGKKQNSYLIFLKKHKGKPIQEIRELWKKQKSKK